MVHGCLFMEVEVFLILILLKKFRKKPFIEFLSAMLVCGVVEYGASYVLERMHNGVRWWDYSDYF